MILCQITDLHIKAQGRKSYRVVDTAASLRRCVDSVNQLRQRPDAVVLTGDLVDFGQPEEYAFLRELLQPLTMPYYLLPGNHDERGALRAAFPDHAYLHNTHDGNERIEYVIDDHPLRIVALEEYAAAGPALPFIADDVLQTFDDARTRASLEALLGLSEHVQVIALTHHSHVAEIAAGLPVHVVTVPE